MPNIVIVGGGIAGLEFATQFGRKYGSRKDYTITLIDKDTAHLWKPKLHTMAAGTNDLYLQLESFIAHAHINNFIYSHGKMCGVDRVNKKVLLEPLCMSDGTIILKERSVKYDVLIIAVGSITNDFNLPGVKEHCYFIDNRRQADTLNKALRMYLLRSANDKEKLNISIVGGGATGVEFVAELEQLIANSQNYGFDLKNKITINLIESGPVILPAFPKKICMEVKKLLDKLGINILMNTQVVTAKPEGFELADGTLLPSNIMVWTAGVKAPECLQAIEGLEITRNNMLHVTPTLQTTKDKNIFAIGDCAYVVDNPLPTTAQVAHQQSTHLLNEIPKWLNGGKMKPFKYHHLGGIVSLGTYNAYGSLGKYGLFPGGFIKGWFAKLSYNYIYRSHQKRIHGICKGYLIWLAERINKFVRPPIRLD